MTTTTVTLPDFQTVDFDGRQLGVYDEDVERPTCSHVTQLRVGALWTGDRTSTPEPCMTEAFGLLDGQPLCMMHLRSSGKDLVVAIESVASGLIVPFKTEQINTPGGILRREHFRITVPEDCADTEAERDEIAFNEARELCWVYRSPANWVIESRTGGSDITYTLVLES